MATATFSAPRTAPGAAQTSRARPGRAGAFCLLLLGALLLGGCGQTGKLTLPPAQTPQAEQTPAPTE